MDWKVGGWQVNLNFMSDKPNVKLLNQVHGRRIGRVNESEPADGIVVFKGDQGKFGIRTADCLPLVLASRDKILIAHLSRKSAIAGLLMMIKREVQKWKIEGILLGPHICQDHFRFEKAGRDVQIFLETFPAAVERHQNFWRLSLRKVALEFIQNLEIDPGLVIEDGRCTYADNLPSYKREVVEGGMQSIDHLVTWVSAE
jgi:copper oxidase (laccase) domain-containing protein